MKKVQRAFSCQDAEKKQGKVGGLKRNSLRLCSAHSRKIWQGQLGVVEPKSLIREVLHVKAMVFICTPRLLMYWLEVVHDRHSLGVNVVGI